ncbi:type I restriction enzyme M protein [Bacteroidales bacterium WCE2008]|nr:type I restriction enzyme M protein [Bacteroidales bacterium WCE2008]
MAVKKSQLYSTLWESCNALRGSMDASQYKDYVLMILFVKYLSDKAHQKQTPLQIPEGCYFEDFVALKQNDHIGELINEKLEAIREANAIYIGDLTLPNFNDPAKLGETKTRTETLSKLIAEFQRNELNFGLNRAADDDLLGDAYEYLMKNFAAESGKSKGQFYTPAEVSRVMAKVLHLENLHRAGETIYDPTCGSGSLLLRALNETSTGKCAIRGQELDSTTAALAKLNMLLHGIVTAQIKVGDTLNAPKFTTGGMLETFDVCVANPPFSKKNWLDTGSESDEYHRWSASLLPPYKCGDFAFLLHLIASMKENTGRGACILPHGVLFRGNAEYDIRKDIVKKKYIKGIIGLPSNLFFGTGIPACIIIIDKAERESREGIFMINAKDGFIKDGAKNRLREQDIKLIVDTWNNWNDIPNYARFVKWAEIEKNDYNLNLSRYITPLDTEILQDIHAHINLRGGLPEHDIQQMTPYWAACPSLKRSLFSDYTPGYFKLNVDIRDIAQCISGDDSFIAQTAHYKELISHWLDTVRDSMMAVAKDCAPKSIIGPWGDSLLSTIPENSLVNRYDVYNYLMNYWLDTMQDDCYMVSNDGWIAQPYTPQPKEKKKKDGTIEKPKVKVATTINDIVCDLLPVEIIVNEFFKSDKIAIDDLSAKVDETQGRIDAILEDKADYFEDFEKVSEAKINGAIKEVKKGVKKVDKETISVWEEYLALCKQKKQLSKTLSISHLTLLKNVFLKYENGLTSDQIQLLVVDKKWSVSLYNLFDGAMRKVSLQITSDITSLAKRYEDTLRDLDEEVVSLEKKVGSHLIDMGFEYD